MTLYFSMNKADLDGNGTLSCEEFATMSIHLRKMSTDELLTQAFSFFDKDQNGYIEYDELREALMDDNEKVIQDIISDVDSDKVSISRMPILHFFFS